MFSRHELALVCVCELAPCGGHVHAARLSDFLPARFGFPASWPHGAGAAKRAAAARYYFRNLTRPR